MHDLIISIAKALEATPWAVLCRESNWAYPYIQLIHFTGLSIWIGTSYALDLRLLGIGVRRDTAASIARDLFVWNWIGFAITLTGGFILFSALASSFVENPAFQWKLGMAVPLSLVWHIFVQHRSRDWGATQNVPAAGKLAAATEIVLWILVATAAVRIPNY